MKNELKPNEITTKIIDDESPTLIKSESKDQIMKRENSNASTKAVKIKKQASKTESLQPVVKQEPKRMKKEVSVK